MSVAKVKGLSRHSSGQYCICKLPLMIPSRLLSNYAFMYLLMLGHQQEKKSLNQFKKSLFFHLKGQVL